MPRASWVFATLSFLCPAFGRAPQVEDRAAKWEKEVAAIERRQAEKPPAKGGVVFAGSSSIRLWDLAKSFPDWHLTNSAFGGSEIRDTTLFAERLILKHGPKAIVFYAGDNDIATGRSPEQVRDDFKAFAGAVHKSQPKTRIYFIAIKPSVARWQKHESIEKANALIKEVISAGPGLDYIDIVPGMLGRDGRPKAELFVKDGLHLSEKGYELWTEAVKAAVK